MYKTIHGSGEGELEEKKSRFIAHITHIDSEEEAAAFIAGIKKQYWDARHNCSAFVLGPNNEVTRCSDDGEPSGTAGRPMLDVLIREGLHDCVAVVTRYFGGTLLGTGGLVRAYQGAMQAGLTNCEIMEIKPGRIAVVLTDYNSVGKLQYIIAKSGIFTMDTEYTDNVKFTLMISEENVSSFSAEITEATAGKASVNLSDALNYAIVDGQVKLF